jgi:hypothetical protein
MADDKDDKKENDRYTNIVAAAIGGAVGHAVGGTGGAVAGAVAAQAAREVLENDKVVNAGGGGWGMVRGGGTLDQYDKPSKTDDKDDD